MTPKNVKRLRTAIDAQVSRIAMTVTYSMYNTWVANTPYWSGKTIRSYKLSKGTPQYENADDGMVGTDGTNSMEIGSEPGRPSSLAVAKRNLGNPRMFDKPYDVYYITNAASTDSWLPDFSELEQGEGWRLRYQIQHRIPGYNIGTKEFTLTPRISSNFIELAKQSVSVRFHVVN